MKILISATSKKQEHYRQKVDELADPIAQHLVYCYLYSNHSNFKYWLTRITIILEQVYKDSLVKKGNIQKQKHLHEILFESVLADSTELFDLCRLSVDHQQPDYSDFSWQHKDALAYLYVDILKLYISLEATILDRTFAKTNAVGLIEQHITKFITTSLYNR